MKYCKYCMSSLPNESARFCPRCGKDLAVPEAEHHLSPGTVVGGKIELGAALGEGGFGITYIGRDVRLDLRVAVKEFYPYGFVNRNAAASPTVSCSTNDEKQAFFEKGRARFLQEARTLARFAGEPGIVDVRDFFEENGTAYIVMEYLEGETLKAHLKKRGKLPVDETLRLLTPVMRSLSKIHKENLIHRDVSPDNIMLTETGVKLLDFGAARFVEGDQKSLSVMLKHGYAPYEQYQSHGNQGPWTDVYALCATIYKCITGVRIPEATDRLLEDSMQLPSALDVAIDPATEEALMKGLAVRPNDRWQSMDALLAALEESKKAAAEAAEREATEKAEQQKPEQKTPANQPEEPTKIIPSTNSHPGSEKKQTEYSSDTEPISAASPEREQNIANLKNYFLLLVTGILYRKKGTSDTSDAKESNIIPVKEAFLSLWKEILIFLSSLQVNIPICLAVISFLLFIPAIILFIYFIFM